MHVWEWQHNFQLHRNGKNQEWPRQIWRAQGETPFSLHTRVTEPRSSQNQKHRGLGSRGARHHHALSWRVSATYKRPWCCQGSNCVKPQPLSTACEYSMYQNSKSAWSTSAMRQRPQLDTKWAPLSRKQQPARTEGPADPSVHIQTWTLSDIFSEMNKISLPLQGKQLMLLVASHKTGAFQQKPEVWKTCVHDWGLESTSTFGHLSEDIGGDGNRCDLWKKNKAGCWKASLSGSSPFLGNLLLYKRPACGAAHSRVGRRFAQSAAANQEKLLPVTAGVAPEKTHSYLGKGSHTTSTKPPNTQQIEIPAVVYYPNVKIWEECYSTIFVLEIVFIKNMLSILTLCCA